MELLALAKRWMDSIEDSQTSAKNTQNTSEIFQGKQSLQWNEPLISWFLTEKNLPLKPFSLKPAVRIIDPQKFYRSLKEDIELGPIGPRALFGALQDDLKCLRLIVDDRM